MKQISAAKVFNDDDGLWGTIGLRSESRLGRICESIQAIGIDPPTNRPLRPLQVKQA
jgi:hypothetical protein